MNLLVSVNDSTDVKNSLICGKFAVSDVVEIYLKKSVEFFLRVHFQVLHLDILSLQVGQLIELLLILELLVQRLQLTNLS